MLQDAAIVTARYVLENKNAFLGAIILSLALFKLVIYPFYLSPLKDIPGPYWHRVSHLPALEGQRRHVWIKKVHDLHAQYGKVVLLSPTAVSFNEDPKYVHDIYVKNMPKAQFYANFTNHGPRPNMFASLDNKAHLRFRRMIQNLYSKSAIFNPKNSTRNSVVEKVGQLVLQVSRSSVLGKEPDYINARLALNHNGKGYALGSLDWFNKKGKSSNLGIDVHSLFGAFAMDNISAFELGPENGTKMLLNPEDRYYLIPFRLIVDMTFWTTLMPRFWDIAAGPVIRKASRLIEKWQLDLYAKAEENVPQRAPGQNLSTLETLKKHGLQGKNAYSSLTDNIFAGHETTAIQLTYTCYELSRPANKHRQEQLQKELREHFGSPNGDSEVIDDLEAVDRLPYMEALMQETSRLHAAIPGAEPRVTDKNYEVVVGEKKVSLPVGTEVSMQPYLMHRVTSVFPDPELYLPERWLQEPGESEDDYAARMTNMQRYMMGFGKGVRMCLGMNLARIEMKMALANLYWRYSSDICRDWCTVNEESEKATALNGAKAGLPVGLHLAVSPADSDEKMMLMFDAYTTRPLHDECWLEWLAY